MGRLLRAALAGLVALVVAAVACDAPAPPMAATSPAPEPSPAAETPRCELPPGGPVRQCPREIPEFAHQVNEAIARAQWEHPEFFDFSQWLGGLAYGVRDYDGYQAAVMSNLRDLGFCTAFDGGEIAIKNTNAFSEQYRVFASDGYVRWGAGAYRATCRPAWF
jgi:hypothetical protein